VARAGNLNNIDYYYYWKLDFSGSVLYIGDNHRCICMYISMHHMIHRRMSYVLVVSQNASVEILPEIAVRAVASALSRECSRDLRLLAPASFHGLGVLGARRYIKLVIAGQGRAATVTVTVNFAGSLAQTTYYIWRCKYIPQPHSYLSSFLGTNNQLSVTATNTT
jgi:hypothetical protein